MNYYVYQYIDPRNNQIFYVGKGIGNRKNFHLNKVKNNPTVFNFKSHLLNTIKIILSLGLEPIIEIVKNNLLELDALLLEKQLIEKFGRKFYDENGILCNVLLGNLVSGTVSQETKQKISKIHKGRIYSDAQCLNISKAKKGKKQSNEHKNNVSIAVKNRWNTDLELQQRHKESRNDPTKNRSKTWLVEDLLSNTVIEVLNLTSWCKEQGWNKNESQQLYRTLKNPTKHINNIYQSSGYRLIKS